uniref:hypothetical protein n=1 Tax=Thermoplasma sp. TaxID=1973142 RepID=UPI0026269112
ERKVVDKAFYEKYNEIASTHFDPKSITHVFAINQKNFLLMLASAVLMKFNSIPSIILYNYSSNYIRSTINYGIKLKPEITKNDTIETKITYTLI